MAAALTADARPRRWRGAAAGLGASVVALGVALLVPRLFSDPVGVDPFAVRLGAVAAVLLAVCALWSRAREARPVVLAVASIAVPFTLWAAAPDAALRIAGDRLSWQGRVLAADSLYAVATAVFAVAAVRWLDPDERPALRLRAFAPRAGATTVVLLAMLVVVGLAVPAGVLGRMGVQPVALARDLPLLGPAYVLQAAAQELQFRGLLLGVLERRVPAWAAVGGQAVLFGLAHIAVQYEGPAGPFVPVTVALGLVLGAVTRWTGSLWPAVVVHGAAEVAVPVAILPGLYGF